jgi:hypothetical protein
VIEQGSSEAQQSKALQLLLTLIRRNPELAIDFEIMSGPQMLSKVLMSKRCIVGFAILEVSVNIECAKVTHSTSQSLTVLRDTLW